MYCRACYYDLRGQEIHRCPECGREYDPANPRTFLHYPSRFRGFRLEFNKIRGPIAIILTSLWVLLMILGPPRIHAVRRHNTSPRDIRYIKMITVQRAVWQQKDSTRGDFDRQRAVRDLPALWSPYTERKKFVWGKRLGRMRTVAPTYAIPTIIYAVLMVLLVQGRKRWLAIVLLALSVWWILGPLRLPEFVTGDCKPSHAYLDDYVYINDVDLGRIDGTRSRTIAAYDWRSFEGEKARLVIFTDFRTARLGDDEARSLFEAQGLEYPALESADTDD